MSWKMLPKLFSLKSKARTATASGSPGYGVDNGNLAGFTLLSNEKTTGLHRWFNYAPIAPTGFDLRGRCRPSTR